MGDRRGVAALAGAGVLLAMAAVARWVADNTSVALGYVFLAAVLVWIGWYGPPALLRRRAARMERTEVFLGPLALGVVGPVLVAAGWRYEIDAWAVSGGAMIALLVVMVVGRPSD